MTPQREQAEHLLAAGQRDQTAVRILRKDPESPVEIILFHAQQAAEKYIKAVLVDYVEMQWLMLQQEQPEDFVIATGEQHRVRDFITIAAGELGIGLCWEGQGIDEIGIIESISAPNLRNPGGSSDYTGSGIHSTLKPGDIAVRVDPRYVQPTEVETLLGDPGKARAELGWSPRGQWVQSNLKFNLL